ncbi:MAG: hypothetical protein CTY36_08030, partial [Methylocystis sp.]
MNFSFESARGSSHIDRPLRAHGCMHCSSGRQRGCRSCARLQPPRETSGRPSVMGPLAPLVPHFLAFHVLTLALWCAGLIALPLMLSHHDPSISQSDYARIRRYTHFAYTLGVTPAAVLAVASGTALVFLRDAFTPWMFLKLVFVGALVLTHGWVGHTVT